MSEFCNACGHNLDKMDAGQVGRALNQNFSGIYKWISKPVGYTETVEGLGEVELVHNGTHPDGAGLAAVWKTRAGFVMITGYEDSYSDPEWNYDWKFVTPQTKEVTVYE